MSKEELASALDKLEFHTLDHRRAKTLLLVDLQYNRSQLAEARSRVAFLEHALQMYRTEDSRLLRTQVSVDSSTETIHLERAQKQERASIFTLQIFAPIDQQQVEALLLNSIDRVTFLTFS